MKTKLLTACVAAALLSGCGGSDTKDPTKQVQAYDGAIWGMPGTYQCADGTSGPIPRTNYDGFADISADANSQVITNPELCDFTFGLTDAQKADPNFVVQDTSNGKNMKNVQYKVPRGFASVDTKVTASPLTTFIAEELGNDAYTPEKGKAALEKIGIDVDALENAGVTLETLLTDTDAAVKQLRQAADEQGNDPDDVSQQLLTKVVATTHVLSDTLVANNNAANKINTTQLADSVKSTVDTVTTDLPTYPIADDGNGGKKEVVINVADKVQEQIEAVDPEDPDAEVPPVTVDPEDVGDAEVPERPADPDQPPTGTGTGGGGTPPTGD